MSARRVRSSVLRNRTKVRGEQIRVNNYIDCLVFVPLLGFMFGFFGMTIGAVVARGGLFEFTLASAGIGAGIGLVPALACALIIARDHSRAFVGERTKDFKELDAALTRLEARRDEDPDLVDGVVRGILEVRSGLVQACVEYERVKDELDEEHDKLSERLDGEFSSAHALLSECEEDLDTQKRLSRRSEVKAQMVEDLLSGGALERLRGDLSARRGALREIEEIGR